MEPCSKSDYFKAKIDKVDNHRLFKTVDRLFTSGLPVSPTIYNSLDSLSENFNDFYVQRIRNLRNELEGISKDHAIPVANDSVRCFHLFSQFEIWSLVVIRLNKLSDHFRVRLVHSTQHKSSSKESPSVDAISPVITAIVNESLNSGEFPSALKQLLIRPVLKKPDLDKDVLKKLLTCSQYLS